MRIALLFFCVIFAIGCQRKYQPSTKEQLANGVINKVAAHLKKERELYPIGSGGRMMHQIKMLALSFNYYKDIGIEEGRELLLVSTDEFIAAVNADEQIRSYLDNYPFEPKNIQIRIFLRNPDGSNPISGRLSVISSVDGILEYDIRDPKTDHLKTTLEETYEEGHQKLADLKVAVS